MFFIFHETLYFFVTFIIIVIIFMHFEHRTWHASGLLQPLTLISCQILKDEVGTPRGSLQKNVSTTYSWRGSEQSSGLLTAESLSSWGNRYCFCLSCSFTCTRLASVDQKKTPCSFMSSSLSYKTCLVLSLFLLKKSSKGTNCVDIMYFLMQQGKKNICDILSEMSTLSACDNSQLTFSR